MDVPLKQSSRRRDTQEGCCCCSSVVLTLLTRPNEVTCRRWMFHWNKVPEDVIHKKAAAVVLVLFWHFWPDLMKWRVEDGPESRWPFPHLPTYWVLKSHLVVDFSMTIYWSELEGNLIYRILYVEVPLVWLISSCEEDIEKKFELSLSRRCTESWRVNAEEKIRTYVWVKHDCLYVSNFPRFSWYFDATWQICVWSAPEVF